MSEARVQRLLAPDELDRAVERSRGRPGTARVRNLLAREAMPAVTHSEAERRVRALLRDARLPAPQANVVVAGFEADLLWPTHRLVVEIDGYAVHGHRLAFERDRVRDATLVAAGYRVVSITWRQLTEQPLLVVANIARALVAG